MTGEPGGGELCCLGGENDVAPKHFTIAYTTLERLESLDIVETKSSKMMMRVPARREVADRDLCHACIKP